MKVSKPIVWYLPELLINRLKQQLDENPPKFKYRKEIFCYIIHRLITKEITNKKKEYHPINKEQLKIITGYDTANYIKYLVNGKFIISDHKPLKGKKRCWYKINEELNVGVKILELQPKSELFEAIIKFQRKGKAHYNRLEPHLKLMKDEFMKMELDYSGAKKWALNNAINNQLSNNFTSICRLEDKRFRYFKRNKTNFRLDTNLTNLKSELRQFIVGDYVGIDAKNSQPLLVGVLIDSILNPRDTLCYYLHQDFLIKRFGRKAIKEILLVHQKQEKPEMVNLRSFYASVVQGKLYEDYMSIHPGKITRKVAKNIILKVSFSRNLVVKDDKIYVPYDKHKKIFASAYPFTGQVLKILKNKDHKILPIYLQQLESYLFIDRISKELVDHGITPFTIHDSVIVKNRDQEETIKLMTKVYMEELGVEPALDIKKLRC